MKCNGSDVAAFYTHHVFLLLSMTLQVAAWRGLSQGEPCVQMSDSLDQLLRIWSLSIWFLYFLIYFFLNACFNCSHENYYPEVKGKEFGMALSAEKAKTPKCILQTTKPQALLFFFFSGLAITPFPQIIVLVVAGGCCNWWLYLSAMVEEWQIKMDKFPPVWTDSLSLELLMDQALAKGG